MSRNYGSEPTQRGDEMAAEMRDWYEANRESWWDHRRAVNRPDLADNFMLRLLHKAREIFAKEAADLCVDEGP